MCLHLDFKPSKLSLIGIDLKTAIVVIDMIKDFVTGKLGFKGAVDVVPNIRNLIAAARVKSIPVIYVCDAHSPEDPEMKVWGEHAIAGSEGAQMVPELRPEEGEPVFPKHTYTIFYSDEPDGHLRKLGVEELVLVGVVTDICIQNSVAGAFFHGYRVVVPRDCTASPEKKDYEHALDYMKRIYGAEITTSNEIIEGWEK